jgi:formylglycine-generating enzyme required for sulfatase activity
MKKFLPSLVIILIVLPFIAGAAEVKNLKLRHVGDKAVAMYDLISSSGEEEAEVTVAIIVNGERKTSDKLSITGDFGKNVRVGPGKKIVWDAAKDLPHDFAGQLRWDVKAVEDFESKPKLEEKGEKAAKTAVVIKSEMKDPTNGMEFVLIKGGCYQMGDTFGDGMPDEQPVHEVCVNDFYMGKYVVTQGQWQAIMGSNPSDFSSCGDNCPVENVSWIAVQEFISKLNKGTRERYRLPTEAEWEYAARSGGKQEKWSGTSSEADFGDYAWFNSNADKKTHPVGTKAPNGLGLYDMIGNVWQWMADWYGETYYNESPRDNPQGPNSGYFRVSRGGSWNNGARYVRASLRGYYNPFVSESYLGFRLVRTP